ncbi:Protein kinase-like (PK-like) [Glarea lozoyensis ATCC 20868]|uniref:Protein kinase-like (PK-like) n=1 Tax=Glarea lozoyensis (strain ATCC 20868 / MF5171) TaxID=1116229 RepID=S3D8Y7_GLAL2|nr:Protein kinase-like (PK-like) [Glarea lozoyensis ATCC 20868]EPE34180.1 Protein kinase-like (PK-like) [Glarea lozoyensis ATCC 20868]
MATTNHNHINYQTRIDFVQNLIKEQFGIDKKPKITPLQYDPDSPYKYNNFVYHVTLPSPITTTQTTKKPGFVPIPANTKDLIFRLTNSAADGMHMATRVENEVAIISLASAALAGITPHVVPSVYAWSGAAGEGSQGWMIQEFMSGVPLNESYEAMSLDEKRGVFAQIARILKGLQDYKLPESITDFGGVTFDDDGRVISAAMTTVGAGPWESYEASFKGRLKVALEKADGNPYIKGWRANGIRQRLDAFVESGVSKQFEGLESKEERVIVHADFTTFNILFNPQTTRITALLDYDFSFISHPSYEHLRSFSDTGGQFRGWTSSETLSDTEVRNAKLHGFPSPLPPDGEHQWDVLKAWEEELERCDVKRPRNIKGMEGVADVDSVLEGVLPFRLDNSDVLKLQSEEVVLGCRRESEVVLDGLLTRLGY